MEDLIRELSRDPEFVRADNRARPYYEFLARILKSRYKRLGRLVCWMEPALTPVLCRWCRWHGCQGGGHWR